MAKIMWVELVEPRDRELHRQAKTAAAAQGVTLRQWVLQAVQAHLTPAPDAPHRDDGRGVGMAASA